MCEQLDAVTKHGEDVPTDVDVATTIEDSVFTRLEELEQALSASGRCVGRLAACLDAWELHYTVCSMRCEAAPAPSSHATRR